MKLCSHPMFIIDSRTNHLHYKYMSKSKSKSKYKVIERERKIEKERQWTVDSARRCERANQGRTKIVKIRYDY